MDSQVNLSAADLLRLLSSDSSKSTAEVIYRASLNVLVCVTQISNEVKAATGYIMFVLTLPEQKQGYQDRIIVINSEEFEVISVKIVMRTLSRLTELRENFLGNSPAEVRKKSADVDRILEDSVSSSVFSPVNQAFLYKSTHVEISRVKIVKGNEVFIGYIPEFKAFAVIVDGNIVLIGSEKFAKGFDEHYLSEKSDSIHSINTVNLENEAKSEGVHKNSEIILENSSKSEGIDKDSDLVLEYLLKSKEIERDLEIVLENLSKFEEINRNSEIALENLSKSEEIDRDSEIVLENPPKCEGSEKDSELVLENSPKNEVIDKNLETELEKLPKTQAIHKDSEISLTDSFNPMVFSNKVLYLTPSTKSKKYEKTSLSILKTLNEPIKSDDFIEALTEYTLYGTYASNLLSLTGTIKNNSSSLCEDSTSSLSLFTKYRLSYIPWEVISEFTDPKAFYLYFNDEFLSLKKFNDSQCDIGFNYFFTSSSKLDGFSNKTTLSGCKILYPFSKALRSLKIFIKQNSSLLTRSCLERKVNELCVALSLQQHQSELQTIIISFIQSKPELVNKEFFKVNPESPHSDNFLIENGLPILTIASFSSKYLNEIALLLNYKLKPYKRVTILEPNTIYEAEDIPFQLYQSKAALVLALDWNEECESRYTEFIKTQKKAEIHPRLMKYCKKNVIEVIPRLNTIYSNVREKIKAMEIESSEYILVQNDKKPSEVAEFLFAKVNKLPRFSNETTKLSSDAPEFIPEERLIENKPICFLLVPMGIPGIGKSYLARNLQAFIVSLGLEYYLISSDAVRSESIKEYTRKNLSADFDKAFLKTAKTSNTRFYHELFEKIKGNSGKLFIYCDKNHPPQALDSLIKKLTAENINNCEIKIIGLVPLCKKPIETPHKQFHISMKLLISCMVRTLHRENHLTLVGSPSKQLNVVLSMLNLYKNQNFDEFLSEGKVDFLIKVPFIDEDSEIGSENLKNLLASKLQTIKYNENVMQNDLEEITEEVQKISRVASFDNTPEIQAQLLNILKFKSIPQPISSKRISIDVHEETKTTQKSNKGKKPEFKRKPKHPTYLGIDLNDTLGPLISALALNSLKTIYQKFEEKSVMNDLIQLENFKNKCNSWWKFPQSTHVTTLFIGSETSKLDSKYYKSFNEGESVEVEISSIVYAPKAVICAVVRVVGESQVLIENKIPHCTLLVASKPPKYSNTILHHSNLDEDISMVTFKDENRNQSVFSLKLKPPVVFRGINNFFF